LLRPVTVMGEPLPDAVNPPGLDVATYVATCLPSYAGSVNDTVACPLPAEALTDVGGSTYFPWLEVFPGITSHSSRQSAARYSCRTSGASPMSIAP